MPKASVVSIILLSFSLITLIFSFSSYWYYDKTKVNGKIILEHFYDYSKYKTLKFIESNSSTTTTTTTTIEYYDSKDEYENRNYLTIYRLSLAFSSLSFTCIFLTIIYLFYQALRKSHHPPNRFHQYIKIFFKMLILFGVLCSSLSMFIFIGLNDEKKKDCLRLYQKNLCSNINTKFIYSYSYNEDIGSSSSSSSSSSINNENIDSSSDSIDNINYNNNTLTNSISISISNLNQTNSFHFYSQPYIAWYMVTCSTFISIISIFVIFMGDAFDTTKLSYQTIE